MNDAPRRRALGALALGALTGIGGCAAPPMLAALQQAPPADLPLRVDLDDTPFFSQDDVLCGPAVLASLLAAAGRPVPISVLTPQVYLPGRQGTLQTEMLAGARRHGVLAVELPARLDAALQEVAAGHPVAVLLNLSLPWWPRWHYAVLTGYDLPQANVCLHSGTRAHDEWPMATFERTWARSGHWAFVALPPGRLPRTATEVQVTRALLGMDRAAPPEDAATAWTAAAQYWPDNLTLAVGSGNAWLTAGQLASAGDAFERAVARFDSAAAWNNLAQVRLRQGQRTAAVAAAQRAVRRAELFEPRWLDTARQTLAEVSR